MNKRQKLVQQRFLDNETAILDDLEKIYNEALEEINENIELLMARADADTATVVYQVEYQKALKKQISGILDNMNTKQFTSVSDYLATCYDDGFIGTMYDLHGQGIPIMMPIDQEQLVSAIQTDSKISQGLYTRMGEDVATLKKNIASEVTRGIANGSTFAQVAQQISYKMVGTNYNVGGALSSAMRIARTEGHRIQIEATMNACYGAKEKGADIVKQWDSTLDKRTRKSHSKVDGEIRELDEPFSNGLMYPSDSSGGAAEVVNCRCALLQRARWALDEEELQTLKDRAKYFGLDKTDSFDEFKDKYLKVQKEMDESFAWKLANTKLSPHNYEYKTFEDFWEARKNFIANNGTETDYLDDVFAGKFDIDRSWSGSNEGHKIAQLENTLAELQKKYPINPTKNLEYGTTIRKVRVCDYENAHLYLPDGLNDRRLVDSAIGQVFVNDDLAVIAFDRNWMYQTLEDAIEERSKAISTGKILDTVNGSSPQTVAMHEWGHLMSDHITNAMINGETIADDYWKWYKTLSKDEIRAGLSNYATTNRGEFEAECFAELMMPNPRPLALKYKEYLDKCIELGY